MNFPLCASIPAAMNKVRQPECSDGVPVFLTAKTDEMKGGARLIEPINRARTRLAQASYKEAEILLGTKTTAETYHLSVSLRRERPAEDLNFDISLQRAVSYH